MSVMEEVAAWVILAVVCSPILAMWLGMAVSLYRDMVKPTPRVSVQRKARER